MKSTGTKKPCPTTNQMQGLVAITKDVKHMTNLTLTESLVQNSILNPKDATFTKFLDSTQDVSEQLQTLCHFIIKETSESSTERNLAEVMFRLLSILRDDCITKRENLTPINSEVMS